MGLIGREGTSGSVTAACSCLETQSSEILWDVPLQNQGPLDLKRPEGQLPQAGDFTGATARTSLPTLQRQWVATWAFGGHHGTGRQNLLLLELWFGQAPPSLSVS